MNALRPAEPERRPEAWSPVAVWHFRELLRGLVVRDLKIKYQRSLLGLLWTLVNPLMTVCVLIAVFSYVIRIRIDQYWAFLISGFFVWNYIQRNLYHATTILREHASLRRSVYFPTEVLILGLSFSKLAEFLLEMVVVLALLYAFRHRTLPSSLVLFPAIVLIQVLMAVGLVFPLSVASVMFYDVQHVLPIVVSSLFYLTPVFYPVEMIPPSMQGLYHLNPLVGVLQLYHVVLYDGRWPSATLLLSVAASSLVTFVVGYLLFRRYRDVCVEIA